MKKMKTVFIVKYNDDSTEILDEVRKENEWVLNGEGVATIKFDGTATTIINGVLFKRFDRKLTKKWNIKARRLKNKGETFNALEHMFKVLPENSIPCQDKPDPITFHHPHWIQVSETDTADTFLIEAFNSLNCVIDGTYEMVGEKVQANPHNLTGHHLWKHGSQIIEDLDLTFDGIRNWLSKNNVEGIVFHHPDGRMAKIRKRDFGLRWNDEHMKR